MRKIKIAEHISLDGVISMSEPDGDNEYAHGDWNGDWTAAYRTVEGAAAVAGAYGKHFDLLLGRRTYDLWAGVWPATTSGPFAAGINAATKYVATHRPESLSWGPVGDLGADVLEGIRRLKAQEGPDLVVCGSSTLTSLLLKQGLVDEMMLAIYPVLLGRGKRLLADSVDPHGLTLVHSQTTPTGVLINTYRHVGSLRPDEPDTA